MALKNLQADFQQALALHQQGRLPEAKAIYLRLLKRVPNDADLLRLLGTAEYRLGNARKGMDLLDKSLKINPNQPACYNSYGLLLQDLNRFDEAIVKYDRALKIKPDYAVAYNNRGNALAALKRLDEALASYDRALALEPKYAEAHFNRGIVLYDLKRLDEAVLSYERALRLGSDSPEVLFNLGIALQDLNRLQHAVECYEKAIALNPGYAEAYANCGNALREQKQYSAALARYEKAIALNPGYAEAYNNRGNVYMDQKQYDAALASYEMAANLKPDYAEAHNNCGNALKKLKRGDAALASLERALALKPDIDYLPGNLLSTRMSICEWGQLEVELPRLLQKIAHGEKASNPFQVLPITDDPFIHRKAAEIYVADKYPERNDLGEIPKYNHGNVIRVGYFSADFRQHPVSILIAELFELHNTSRFELVGFSYGKDDQSELSKRVRNSFGKFFEVGGKSNKDVAMLSREQEIDIAVDLGGHTAENHAVGAFSYRAAPIQVNYLGYSSTMGAPYYDYIIADKIVIPERLRSSYFEKIAYLPNSYMANDSKRVISDRPYTREEMGLPVNSFVFCCFNNSYKISPQIFDVWMRILGEMGDSVLWLTGFDRLATENLQKAASARGIDANRLVFAERLPDLADHLARHRLADLFLDTLPYNGHTTTADALWAGLPVLTCMGESFASRVAGSLLKAVGLSELITHSLEEYEALALELARNPEKLIAIKEKLEHRRASWPLFDAALFSKHIEAAYLAMHQRHLDGIAPDHIYIEN